MKWLVCAPLALALGGCVLGTGNSNYLASTATHSIAAIPVLPEGGQAGAAPAQAPIVNALAVLPPEAGRVVKLRETHFINGTFQQIVLAGDEGTQGENVIEVSVRTSANRPDATRVLEIGKPSEAGIRSEILSRFPDVRMSIISQPMRNNIGVFGLAIGRHANGARCIFTWQWTDDLNDHTPGASGFARFGARIGGRGLATSIRVRICRKDATADRLAEFIRDMRVSGRSEVERIAAMDRRGFRQPVTMENGAPARATAVTPSSQPSQPSNLESILSSQTPAARRTAEPARPARPAATRSRAQTRAAPRPRPSQQRVRPETAPPVAPAVETGERRFLAPVSNTQALAPAPASVYRPSLGVSLPPEAYRGPQN